MTDADTARQAALLEAGNKRGLKDPDLVKLADPGKPPEAAIATLHARFPGAFGVPLARVALPADYRIMKRALIDEGRREYVQQAERRMLENLGVKL